MFRKAAALCVAMSISFNSFAMELTVDGYVKYVDKGEIEKDFVLNWLDGLYHGLQWSNAALNAQKGERWFCPPEKMVVTEEQVKSILDHLHQNTRFAWRQLARPHPFSCA